MACASGDPPGSDELEADPEPEHAQPRHWLRLRLRHLRSAHTLLYPCDTTIRKEGHVFCFAVVRQPMLTNIEKIRLRSQDKETGKGRWPFIMD
jgi:hypothetical protein